MSPYLSGLGPAEGRPFQQVDTTVETFSELFSGGGGGVARGVVLHKDKLRPVELERNPDPTLDGRDNMVAVGLRADGAPILVPKDAWALCEA